ncbi:MAG: hypothetical protein U1E10_01455 [Bdellovibrionales bacterium]|jgi:hypothetical protein|nr:hypothetical protein [Bdellovibrionales bacterium]
MNSKKAALLAIPQVISLTGLLFVVGCAPGPSVSPIQSQQHIGVVSPSVHQVAVSDLAGRPIAGAEILFGKSAGVPFSGNVVKTDQTGLAAFPAAWKQELPVTIVAPGYVRATYLSRQPGSHSFVLRLARSNAGIALHGKTTGFGRLVSNGVLDVSLVFPAVSRAALGSLELTALIGNGVDKVSVYGQELELPNNLSVPAQTETYFGFIPVSLDKLNYQVSVANPGTHRVAAVRAQFDFKKTVDDLRAGSSFFDIINRFQFRSYATRDLQLTLPKQTADLPSDEIKLQPKLSVAAKGLAPGYAMLATAAIENQGLCVVTDVKRLLENEKRSLMIPDVTRTGLGSGVLLRSIKKYQPSRTDFSGPDFEEMSSVVVGFSGNDLDKSLSPNFYPILKPITTSGRSLLFSPPGGGLGLSEEQTTVTLSKVVLISSGTLWLVDKTPLWDFYGPGQIDRVDLPSFGTEPWAAKGRYRWELLFSGRDRASQPAALGPTWNASSTHFVKTATDFQVP